MSDSRMLLQLTLLAALSAGCGPGSPGDASTTDDPPPPEWAYGWWLSGGLEGHAEWGTWVMQMEIRPDGTVMQEVDYCLREAWTYESPWELLPDGTLRILPAEGDQTLPFLEDGEYSYIDVRRSDGDSCTIVAGRVTALEGKEFPVNLQRGHWCIGEFIPEFDSCALEQYCGEEAPVCE